MKTDEIMALVYAYRRAWVSSDDTNAIQVAHAQLRGAIEAALKQREGEAIHQVYMDGGWHDKIGTDMWMYGDLPEHDKRVVYTAPPKAQPMSDAAVSVLATEVAHHPV